MAESSRNLERTGLVVILAAAAGFVGVVTIPRLPWTAKNTHSFIVPLDRGIQTLAPGSSVFAAGLLAGEVVSIEPISTTSASREADALKVVFEVPDSFPIFEGAEVRLVSAVIGSDTNVCLFDAFTPGQPRLADGASLRWLPPADTMELIFGTRHWEQLRDSVGRFERLFDTFADERQSFESEADAIRREAVAIADEIESDFNRWQGDRDGLLERFRQARERAEATRESFEALRSAWRSMLEAFSTIDAKIKAFFPASGGNIEDLQLLGAIPDMSRLGDRFQGLVAAADAVAPVWRGLIDIVRGPWDWAIGDVRLSIANTTLAVGQFGLIKKDFERDPIPALLETIGVIAGTIPDQATRDKMQADEALRRFVMATADLRAANAAIEAWMREAPTEDLADPVPPELRDWFERSRSEFAEAAEALFRMRMNVR